MAKYKVAYGKRENIPDAILRGVIPPGCIILTEDSNEILFYSPDEVLSNYGEKYIFSTKEEAESWVSAYDCKGKIVSVSENNKVVCYKVNANCELEEVGADCAEISMTNEEYGITITGIRVGHEVELYLSCSKTLKDIPTKDSYVELFKITDTSFFPPAIRSINYILINYRYTAQLNIEEDGRLRFGYARPISDNATSIDIPEGTSLFNKLRYTVK